MVDPEEKYGHWDVSAVGDFNASEWYGFIYVITNLKSGRRYIGKKNFTRRKRLRPLKGTKRYRVSHPDSDWKTYCSSCDELKNDIAVHGEGSFYFQIIRLCSGKSELTFEEEHAQHAEDVLRSLLPDGTPLYYNGAIGTRHYAGLVKQSAQSRAKAAKHRY